MRKRRVRCDGVRYDVYRSDNKKLPIVVSVSDGNIEEYDLRLSQSAARRLAARILEVADLEIVREVMEA